MKKAMVAIGLSVSVSLIAVLLYAIPKWNEQRVLEEGIVAIKTGDYTKGIRLLSPLSAAGNPTAREMMGLLYAYGWGVTRDRKQAVEFLSTAGVPNLAERFYSIATELEEGTTVAKDQSEAVAWLKLAAEAGHPGARSKIVGKTTTPQSP